jgi:molybdopterin converting factor small subunit
MRVRLLAFASAADRVGAREAQLELDAGATVGDLRRAAIARWPALAPLARQLAIAVDGTVAGDAVTLADGAEIALLPPVSGG